MISTRAHILIKVTFLKHFALEVWVSICKKQQHLLQLCHQDAAFQNAIVGRKRTTEEVDTGIHVITPIGDTVGDSYRVNSGMVEQTATFEQRSCFFHTSVIGRINKLTKQTVTILMRRLIRSCLIWISTVCECVSEFT